MSCPINVEEAQQARATSVADVAPGHTTLVPTGQRGIPVLIAPLHSQRGASAEETEEQRKKWLKEMRGWLMVLATLAASVTYQAGLNPPGGFWQDDGHHHHAGDPVIRDQHWTWYMNFYYLNGTAFVTSLVIMVLLMKEQMYHTEDKLKALMLATFIDLISLIGAYVAGSTRFSSSSGIYVVVIACVAFVGTIYFEVIAALCRLFVRRMPCMLILMQNKWFPVPAEVVRNLQAREEASQARSNQRGACSACCASAPRAKG